LTPSQRKLKAEQERAARGGFQLSSDYYRDILNNEDNATINQAAAPELRRFNEQIVPDLAEQFAGMGAGGLSSSGFRNAAISAGTDLSERVGAIRANLRNEAAFNLNQMGEHALNPVVENVVENEEGGPNALHYAAGIAGGAATGALAGSAAGGVGAVPGAIYGGVAGGAGVAANSKSLNVNAFGARPVAKKSNPYGNSSSPYGNAPPPPPTGNYNPNYKLPTFLNK
jgi:hypothetical protein